MVSRVLGLHAEQIKRLIREGESFSFDEAAAIQEALALKCNERRILPHRLEVELGALHISAPAYEKQQAQRMNTFLIGQDVRVIYNEADLPRLVKVTLSPIERDHEVTVDLRVFL